MNSDSHRRSCSQSIEKSDVASEATTRATVEAAVAGIISIDRYGAIQLFNPAAERLFGYAEEEVLGQNVKMLMPSPFFEEHDRYLANYLKTGIKKIIGIGREVVARRRDGTVFPIDLSVAEAILGDESIFVGIIRDITERKQAEQALQRSHEELQSTLADLQAKNDEVR